MIGLSALIILIWSVPVLAASVMLTWDASPQATHYRLYYGTRSGVYDTVVDTGPATTASLKGLHGNSIYYFAATALNAAGESEFSEELVYHTQKEKS